MAVQITIPEAGESITEVTVGTWHKKSGDWVEKDEVLVEVETDKATQEIYAPESGVLQVQAEEGSDTTPGAVIGTIDPDAERPEAGNGQTRAEAPEDKDRDRDKEQEQEKEKEKDREEPAVARTHAGDGEQRATPVARKVAADKGIDLARIQGTGPSGRVTKADVLAAAGEGGSPAVEAARAPEATRAVRRERMTKLRRRIAERLVEAQQTAAMLTTFNEADMSEVMRLRRRYKEPFEQAHGVGLGFMSFFVKACVSALEAFPRVNAFIVDDEIEYHDFVDVSIAVATERGLVVPVVRDAQRLSFADIEQAIAGLAARARDGQLTVDEMTGGTFTISNGGVYGSLLSTPILNPPQSAILGMHRIVSRPVEDPDHPGEMVLRPMMYLALSYDHRIIDGEQAVRFLVHVRECVEDPQRLLLDL